MANRTVSGVVSDFGGGVFTVLVDRDTENYPPVGARVVASYEEPLRFKVGDRVVITAQNSAYTGCRATVEEVHSHCYTLRYSTGGSGSPWSDSELAPAPRLESIIARNVGSNYESADRLAMKIREAFPNADLS